MRKCLIPFVFLGAWLMQGCVPVEGTALASDRAEGGFGDAETAAENADGGLVVMPRRVGDLRPVEPRLKLAREIVIDGSPRVSSWRPRAHPPGTLLEDARGQLWMTVSWRERHAVSGDDTLVDIGLDEHDAIPMSPEEERCVVPDESMYWGPENLSWSPAYGPIDDTNLYLLDWAARTRRLADIEVLDSWGYYTPWIDQFDHGDEVWASFTDLEESLPFRDGALAHTELATYYLLHGRAYLFDPPELAEEAGYRAEDMLYLSERRLRELAIVTTAFTHEHFNACPADGS